MIPAPMTRACLRFEPVFGRWTQLTHARTLHRSCSSWPACGGANGSIRFEAELTHGANAGLKKGVAFLKEFKENFPLLSWADVIQLASALAIECCGGPQLPMRYGRVDVAAASQCPREGNLPDAKPPFGGGARDAPSHLRAIFYRMGFSDREIVALSGAHTLGRAHAVSQAAASATLWLAARPSLPAGLTRPEASGWLGAPPPAYAAPSLQPPGAAREGWEGWEGRKEVACRRVTAAAWSERRRFQGAFGRHRAKPRQGRRHVLHAKGRDAAGGRRQGAGYARR